MSQGRGAFQRCLSCGRAFPNRTELEEHVELQHSSVGAPFDEGVAFYDRPQDPPKEFGPGHLRETPWGKELK